MTREAAIGTVAPRASIVALCRRLWRLRRFRKPRPLETSSLKHPPVPKTEPEKRILAVIDGIARAGIAWFSVPVVDGRMLRLLTETAGARNVVEIGTSIGYSSLWLCLALQATGGRLTTFEADLDRVSLAREHFQKAGVDHIVTVIEGDARGAVARLKDPIDVLFLDAEKEDYTNYLENLLPLVRPGGMILAHNVRLVPAYVRAVSTNPDLETAFYMEGAGLGITLKKR